MQPEPISPELVLVDPALAERERGRLCEKARLAELFDGEHAGPGAQARNAPVVDVAMLRRAVEQDGGPSDEHPPSAVRHNLRAFARGKLLPAALMCSLLANGVLAADLVVHIDSREAALGVPAAEHHTDGGSALPSSLESSNGMTRSRVRGRALPQRSVIEQKLISLILQAPARRLPRAFVDPATGLVRNNVRVICREAQPRSYLCAIQLPGDGARGGLLVRVRSGRGGKGVFTWYGYKRDVGAARFLQNRP